MQIAGASLLLAFTRALLCVSMLQRARAEDRCEYGALPGTASIATSGFQWDVYDKRCTVQILLPYFALPGSAPRDKVAYKEERLEGVSMLMIGDSVDRHMLRDLNTTALQSNWSSNPSLMNEHWRGALSLANLEMVYQFAPGSHDLGPYHDDLSYAMSIVNALPRAFEMHRLLTGRTGPNVVVFSNTLWDLGRWSILSEFAADNETDYYGLPLLRDSEFLPPELLEEWYRDTHVQMQRVEKYAGKDALLIYHNAAFPKLKDPNVYGSLHEQKGTGRRTHIVQLNALARQMVKERPRWHLVDFGQMSEAFLTGSHLRDPHHPTPEFILKALDIYLNLHAEFGHAVSPRAHVIGDLARWDDEYRKNGDRDREVYQQEYEAERDRWRNQASRKERQLRSRGRRKEFSLRHGYKMLVNISG